MKDTYMNCILNMYATMFTSLYYVYRFVRDRVVISVRIVYGFIIRLHASQLSLTQRLKK